MKFFIIFALALTLHNVSAFDLRRIEFEKRNVSLAAVDVEGGRIINGQMATMGQFPYQVYLVFMNRYYCGGSLIGKKWVLTAAHCTHQADSVVVKLGATIHYSPEITYTVSGKGIITHEGYERKGLKNDIGLIKIPSVTYSARIQPVKLPAISDSYDSFAGYKAIATGWGKTETVDRPSNLYWASIEIISNAVCAKSFRFITDAFHICVSSTSGIAICNGDSGGPLVLESSNILIGLTSFGSTSGCTNGKPAVYTRLTTFVDWIKSKTGISY